ncbi:MAG TPA: T9SS type A sorting domain-containing protein, partial [Catalimonadaceae bacterium]|nr:T9SS type A sorting domain-containing protein [Catalimonadaceae bacterium]
HDFFKLAPLTSVSLTETETYHFRISPNPSNGRFWIQSSSQPSEEIYIQVLNMLGKTIWEGQPNMGINQFEVDLSNQPAGVYSLQIFGSSFKGENRLLKQ